ncbi:folate-binding protein [Kiloniella laminariae]|uniref:Folate-binding protein n=1 Tax=Kiloniella laminariae TaxID=454162 RepID=A0ABT4LEP2_9PROT|nr:folate-binding protein [Kiloniella laminariae]MCZ4279560.1 folate-binding protein [Kiloniella laminariae]
MPDRNPRDQHSKFETDFYSMVQHNIQPEIITLEHRSILALEGEDLVPFLQGLVTQDVSRVSLERAVWSAFLTPQGKFLHEFFLCASPTGGLLLECEKDRAADLLRRLSLYRMRSKVTLQNLVDDYVILALYGEGIPEKLGLSCNKGQSRIIEFSDTKGQIFIDPRHAGLGARAIIPRQHLETFLLELKLPQGALENYDRLRFSLGIPDGSRDLDVEKSILLENGFNELDAIDWKKGCFIGQELTARTKYRALIKKRLIPVKISGPAPTAGSDIIHQGKSVGTLRSLCGDIGLATLRVDVLDQSELLCEEAVLQPHLPDWIEIAS